MTGEKVRDMEMSKLSKAYKLYTEIRDCYSGLSEEEKTVLSKHNPILISTVEFLIKLVERSEKEKK